MKQMPYLNLNNHIESKLSRLFATSKQWDQILLGLQQDKIVSLISIKQLKAGTSMKF